MPKYYVQSGSLELITTANDSRSAAIWAVHRTLSQSLPFLCSEPRDYHSLPCVARLGDEIVVSERGFDSSLAEGVTYDTFDVITEWNQLLVAIDRLEERMNGPKPSAKPC